MAWEDLCLLAGRSHRPPQMHFTSSSVWACGGRFLSRPTRYELVSRGW